MKAFTLAAAFAALASQASAHYIFNSFDGGPAYQYIRQNINNNSPVTDLTSDDLRCNVGGETGGNTQTVSVAAGSTHTFTADVAVYHQGPVSFYMSKASSSAAAYDGSGDWFKIKDIGPTFPTSCAANWTADLQQTFSFTIPKSVPNGDYLVRIQQLAIHNPYPAGIPQFYIECAQVTVTGGGNGVPTPTVKIPGAFQSTDPGYTVNIYSDFCNYTVPGPAVWTG
ncbi:MAG: hypothetical protein M1821_005418 [Bathelium mastoideum]|nr:MAG: hypothetical protein M1821_005418 [Bathelium mastoideum]